MQRYTPLRASVFSALALGISLVSLSGLAYAQTKGSMTSGSFNYEHFREQTPANKDAEVMQLNEGFEEHPELGALFADAPCANCYEVLSQRTETTKTFYERGTRGKHLWVQSSVDPMHYRDEQGRWRTIRHELKPAGADRYVSKAAPVPVGVDTRAGYAEIGAGGQRFLFNRGLELVYIDKDGKERSLGLADWSRHTAGDDGVYVTEMWPGIDMEITVFRGAVKTNFVVQKALPAYAAGLLVIRDHLKPEGGLEIRHPGQRRWHGPLEIRQKFSGHAAFVMQPAVAYEKNNASGTVGQLDYQISEGVDQLDIMVPGTWLNRAATAYPVIIDPLVQQSNSVPVPGSTYSALWAVGCPTLNPAPVPPMVTVTDVLVSLTYTAANGATILNGAMFFDVGTCRSPGPGFIYRCQQLAANCVGLDISILSDIKSCIPAPQCSTYNLNVTLNLSRNIGNNGIACSNDYIIPVTPFTVVVEGHTLESDTTYVSGANATICEGDSTQLFAEGIYGVPPYTYAWSHGATGTPVTVSPANTTQYTVTITDACGNTSKDTITVNVRNNDNPGFTIDPDAVCIGEPVTVTANGTAADSLFSWLAPGSANPSMTGTKTWTTTYSAAGVYDITMNYKSDFCLFPDTRQVTINPSVSTEVTDSICQGEEYRFGPLLLTTAGTYSDTFGTSTGCDSVVILHLKVHPIPPAPVLSSNSPLCQYDDLKLQAALLDGGTYAWSGPGGYRDTGRTPVRPKVPVSATGQYEATVTVKNCTSPASIMDVLVRPVPEIAIQADKTDICAGDTVSFESIYHPMYSYRWNPADFMLENGAATALGKIPYKANIILQVRDTFGCGHTDSIFINTHPCCAVYLPNAFTPNGDGKNDLFRVVTDGYQKVEAFRVVNRWGEVLFSATDQRSGWDGTHKGVPQGAGTYHYYLKYQCAEGGIYEMTGDVILLR
jgi:gliding motility-associated-like protein